MINTRQMIGGKPEVYSAACMAKREGEVYAHPHALGGIYKLFFSKITSL